ncbi:MULTISPECIES: LysR family transcriptional regulator [Comamonas]|uniref:LysR family transcriptional regulator n=1 Tax=Comamonas terrigena TaxID=32013 RepID=A0A2A7UV40_COMTR|nr:LysR substrate-binding domain-containing protein [Comamonas terrigena]MBD9530563.1 LysR family transcriptional regulator [Comamonas sp. CMM01]PEH89229.1 LysR family transcriptional regulator [Comamonas terrigena]BBL24353.1 LysR family transcriptional regulator [Comamonas terrigena NBRC 13299]SUY72050.1 Morphology and auto-aggregation control protein [Comamonas terrigena]
MALRDLQIDWLHCLVAVVDAGSLSAATVQLHRSQSAVSMQLKKLEDAVGHRLLERGARRLELTEQGRTLLGYARRMLDLQAEAQAALQPAVLSGRVRLGVPDDYAATYLTPVLRRFAPRHSGVEIELNCEQSTALIPRVERGELDLALISRDHARRGRLLFHEPMVWVGSPQLELWRRDPLPIAVYEDISLARRGAIHALALQGRRCKVVYHSSSLAGQLAAVESGLAVAALTQCSAPAQLQVLGREQGLGPLAPMQVAAYRSKASRGNAAVDELERLLVQTLRMARGVG